MVFNCLMITHPAK